MRGWFELLAIPIQNQCHQFLVLSLTGNIAENKRTVYVGTGFHCDVPSLQLNESVGNDGRPVSGIRKLKRAQTNSSAKHQCNGSGDQGAGKHGGKVSKLWP